MKKKDLLAKLPKDWDASIEEELKNQPDEVYGQVLRTLSPEDFFVLCQEEKYKPVKENISIRLDADILYSFKKQGKGWQTAMNNALREYLNTHHSS